MAYAIKEYHLISARNTKPVYQIRKSSQSVKLSALAKDGAYRLHTAFLANNATLSRVPRQISRVEHALDSLGPSV